MKKWVLKAIVQKGISFLPYKNKLNYFFQKYLTKGVALTDKLFEDRLIHASNHINHYIKYTNGLNDFTTLELGTGWYPVVPIAMYLCGANKINSVDIVKLTSVKKTKETIEKFLQWQQQNKLAYYLPNLHIDRLHVLNTILNIEDAVTFEKNWSRIGFNFTIEDAVQLTFGNHYIDLIHSNNTLEHIYPDLLTPIFKEFHRCLAKQGIMSHFIDMSDHFAHLDKSITIYNYLQYSEQKWNFIDNSIQPQNRWRINDYKKLYATTNFTILEEINRDGNIAEVENLIIQPPFNQYSSKDIAISHTHIVAKLA